MRRFGNIRSASTDWRSFDDSAGCLSGSGGGRRGIFGFANPPHYHYSQRTLISTDAGRQRWVTTAGCVVSVSPSPIMGCMLRVTHLQSIAKWPWHRTRARFPRMLFFPPSHRKRKTNAMGARPSYWRLHFGPSKFFRTRTLAQYFVLAEALAPWK